jgi:hypothetical protein
LPNADVDSAFLFLSPIFSRMNAAACSLLSLLISSHANGFFDSEQAAQSVAYKVAVRTVSSKGPEDGDIM